MSAADLSDDSDDNFVLFDDARSKNRRLGRERSAFVLAALAAGKSIR